MDRDEIDPQVQLEAAQAEIKRLRARVHEAVDETQRRYARTQSQLDENRALMRWAREEINRINQTDAYHSSLLTQLVVAVLLDENQRLRKVVEAAEQLRDQYDATSPLWPEALADAVDEWRQSRGPDA